MRGVYVHVPFCTTRCDYCAFATFTDRAHLIDTYVDACVSDIGRRVTDGELASVSSVYLGGGTPSLLAPAHVERILAAIPREVEAEVTMECNPDSVDVAKLQGYRAAGVSRVSIGAQSFVPHVLRALGRTHDPENVPRAVDAARAAGIGQVSLDLIFGMSGESVRDWRTTLAAALALRPDHLSAYALTLEPGTRLHRDVAAGVPAAPDDDDQAEKYLIADEAATAAGLDWYEVSNWARPGARCRHNLLYWRGGEYVGIGSAAHGHTCGRRWWNVSTPERYVARVAAGLSPEAGVERLDAVRAAEERLALGLRTCEGAAVPAPAVAEADGLASAGLLEWHDDRAVLTVRGRLLANEVTVRLLAASSGAMAGTR